MARPEYCRFLPSKWRSATMFMSLEQEGLLMRISAFNMEAGCALPDITTAARMLNVQHHKLRKVLAELIASGEVAHDDLGIYSPRAMAENERAAAAVSKRTKTTENNAAARQLLPLLPHDYPTPYPMTTPPFTHPSTPHVDAKKSEQILRATKRRGEERREESTPGVGASATESENGRLHREAYERGQALKAGTVAKSARAEHRTKGELDGSQGVKLENGKLEVFNGSAAEIMADFPGLDLAAVCNRAGPELSRMGWPTRDDAMAVVRKWAQIASDEAKRQAPRPAKQPTPGKPTVAQILAKRAEAGVTA